MVGWNQDASADWLLTQVILQDSLLHRVHHALAKEFYHGEIHARVHQTKGIGSRDYTVKRWQVFEWSTGNLHLRMPAELPLHHIASLLFSINQDQAHAQALFS
jgi:hypothetical protein